MAAYGNAVLTEGKSPEEGLQYLSDLLGNVPVQDESARDSLGTFLGGKGDVLLAYENEAIAAQNAGEDIDYVVPDSTILIQTPLAATETGGRVGADVRRLPVHRRGAAAVGRQRLPAGRPVGPEAEQGQVPDAGRPVHDRRPRWLGQGHRPTSSIRRTVRSLRSSRTWGSRPSECGAKRSRAAPLLRRLSRRGVATAGAEGEPRGSASAAPRSPAGSSSRT